MLAEVSAEHMREAQETVPKGWIIAIGRHPLSCRWSRGLSKAGSSAVMLPTRTKEPTEISEMTVRTRSVPARFDDTGGCVLALPRGFKGRV